MFNDKIGNYHASIICAENEKPRAEEIFNHLRRRAVEIEGTISAEHGIGLGLGDMLAVEVGETGVDMMRKVFPVLPGAPKTCFADPDFSRSSLP